MAPGLLLMYQEAPGSGDTTQEPPGAPILFPPLQHQDSERREVADDPTLFRGVSILHPVWGA